MCDIYSNFTNGGDTCNLFVCILYICRQYFNKWWGLSISVVLKLSIQWCVCVKLSIVYLCVWVIYIVISQMVGITNTCNLFVCMLLVVYLCVIYIYVYSNLTNSGDYQ